MEKWSGHRLERTIVKAQTILTERKKLQSGLVVDKFRVLHTDPVCEIKSEFVRNEKSGFVDPWDLIEAAAHVYILRCVYHGSVSAEYWDHIG